MNTNSIKSFAKKARILLLDGVATRLKYWGFEADGKVQQEVQPTQGGYSFRGSVYTDATVPAKWNKLKKRLADKQAVLDCVEEAAYTWFNRLMAIKILEKNGYIPELLGYANEMRTPRIVQNAKIGQHSLTRQSDINLLVEYLQEDKEDLAFALLITDFCNKNSVLHNVFGKIDDYTELLLPLNLIQKDGVLDLINSDAISDEDYKEVELIGWLYQFYISDKKDEIEKVLKQKNQKVRIKDIPADTQIFTPKWIVKYMVENTVGKIYLDYEPTSSLGSEMKYLVLNESDKETNLSTTEKKSIISDLKELNLIDPACGSGHILVTGFELLFAMYREEGYTAKQAVLAILENNLFGLDIDDRAMQLARFAVLLKAAKYDVEILSKSVLPHIYSFPEEVHIATEELQLFLGVNGHSFIAELKEALVLLNQGKNIGSALKLSLSEDTYALVKEQFYVWNEYEAAGMLDIEEVGVWERLKQHLEVLLVLKKKYTAVVANPPYMGQKKMNGELKNYLNTKYPDTKSDLMTVFIESVNQLLVKDGFSGMVTLDSWMFNTTFTNLRKKIIQEYPISTLCHIGWNCFPEGHLYNRGVAWTSRKTNSDIKGTFINLANVPATFDKQKLFFERNIYSSQDFHLKRNKDFGLLPDVVFCFWITKHVENIFQTNQSLSYYADAKQGMATSDNNRFLRSWNEVSYDTIETSFSKEKSKLSTRKWFPYNKGGDYRKWYGNQIFVINWENNGEELNKLKPKAVIRSPQFYFRECLSWSKVTSSDLSVRFFQEGFIFDVAGCSIFAKNKPLLPLLSLLNSVLKEPLLKSLSQTINFEVGQLSSVPVNEAIFNDLNIVDKTNKCIGIAKNDWDSREISWDFRQSPLINSSLSLNQSYYEWLRVKTFDFFQLLATEEELNRKFIDIYSLQDELTPEVVLKDITILQDELDRNGLEKLNSVFREKGKEAIELPIKKEEVLSQFVSYSIGVFLGRYRLDKPGLNIAHPNPTDEELSSYNMNGELIEIDEDGIVPLMGENCAFPDDVLVRMKQLLLAVWGEETLVENINFLQECLGVDLHKWLTEKFWSYHTSMYKKKPIYWLFTSNPKKPQNAAFKVLVYMHRMDKYTVQKIQRNYLHQHQEHIKQEIEKLRNDEMNLSKQELKRLETLMQWQLECRDYNEVLKELANQQIEFDLDDGVDVNYAKFEGAVAVI
jgi:hypothetical protein